jgi:aspartokinase/homoserine dehydrogenase 1
MKVMKFGGSSMANADLVRDVGKIVLNAAENDRITVVVSAFQGVTDLLLESARLAESGANTYLSAFERIASLHRNILAALHVPRSKGSTRQRIEGQLHELQEVLHGISLLRHCPPRALDLVASFGERLSALIVSSYIQKSHSACDVDARDFIITDDQFTHATVLFDRTDSLIRRTFARFHAKRGSRTLPIVTGFIAATEDGRTTTLGRNGSDYTASIVGAALGASVIEIWTDVDGVMTADPRAVSSAFVVPQLTYEEAMELSYFGATVLHSATIAPAVRKNIPIIIKNTLKPSTSGTLISTRADSWTGVAKGITSIDHITIFTLRGLSMVGVPGTAERLFRALASRRVNVILISQASSEHTICFAVSGTDARTAREAMTEEFQFELQDRLTSIDEKSSQTIVAIVGEGMKGTPGVSGKVFQSLGRNSINVSAIAQGASERNISFVIDAEQKVRALNVIHQSFFEKRKRLALVVVGVGNIGSALLRQLQQQRLSLLSQGFDVRVCGLADSKRYLLSSNEINLSSWHETLRSSRKRMVPTDLVHAIAQCQFTNAALVDCTSSSELVGAYSEFIAANMHIITPNKKANVLPWKQYTHLMEQLRRNEKYFLYEANVGAGLPVISTLQDIVASGDAVVKIEGLLSGTLSYLFNRYDGTIPFSSCVQEAQKMGITEPDPRDDLSGQDVARKLLILARQLGWKMDLKDVQVESLVPPALRRGKFSSSFYGKFSASDPLIKRRYERARSRSTFLRYVGRLHSRTASARLEEISAEHPFAVARGTDSVIAFTTQRYATTPLVVQGPGAGADVTAMGVFSDILKLLHYLPY